MRFQTSTALFLASITTLVNSTPLPQAQTTCSAYQTQITFTASEQVDNGVVDRMVFTIAIPGGATCGTEDFPLVNGSGEVQVQCDDGINTATVSVSSWEASISIMTSEDDSEQCYEAHGTASSDNPAAFSWPGVTACSM